MALGLWTLSKIREKIRNLTARPDSSQVTDSELNEYINRYYRIMLPMEIRPIELQTWFETTLTAGTSEYTLASLGFDDSYLTLDCPAYVSGYEVDLYLDPGTFYSKFPQTDTYDNGLPNSVLLYNNTLTFMQPPSSDYLSFKASAWTRPAELSDDTDTPVREDWGSIIAYGASLELLEDSGDFQTMQSIAPMYEENKTRIARKRSQQYAKRRSVSSF